MQINFQDLLYLKLQKAGREVSNGVLSPSGLEVGAGVRPASTTRVFSTGELTSTERRGDMAIQGDGFFQINVDGQTRYTRDGAFSIDANGSLVTSAGYLVEPSIAIPSTAVDWGVGRDGTVTATSSDGTMSTVGTIQLARFTNPEGLEALGGNLFGETPASGTPITGNAGDDGMGQILGRYLEKANVQMVTELVNLINAQRAYEINSRAIKAGDSMLQQTNNLVR
jgi:flagellar basal-body rod protein FlgG